MDHYRLMLCVLARSHSRRAACPPPARAQVGQAVMDTREKWAPTQNEFKKSHKRTDGRMDAQLAVSDLVFRSLSPSLLPSLRPDRMSV